MGARWSRDGKGLVEHLLGGYEDDGEAQFS